MILPDTMLQSAPESVLRAYYADVAELRQNGLERIAFLTVTSPTFAADYQRVQNEIAEANDMLQCLDQYLTSHFPAQPEE